MNLSEYKEEKPHNMKRIVWYVINSTLFRLFIGRPFRWARHGLLRAFGATIDKDAYIYPSTTIFAPWNLRVGRACIGPKTTIYCKAPITIGDDTVISQGAFLCAAGHDISSLMLPLKRDPIKVGNKVKSDSLIASGKESIGDIIISISTIVAAFVYMYVDASGLWEKCGYMHFISAQVSMEMLF